MNKKKFATIVSFVMALMLAFTAACNVSNDNGFNNVDYERQSYEIAIEKGYEGTLEEWIELLKGQPGKDGKSAYEIAVDSAGFEGTVEQWIASLRGADGIDGQAGKDGRGISDLKIVDGKLYVLYTDSDGYVELGVVKGEDGKDGVDGADGQDGQNGADGFNGMNGKPGADGKDGRSIVDMYVYDGKLYVMYSDKNEYSLLGDVRGEKGETGATGRGFASVKVVDGEIFVKYTDSNEYISIGSAKGDKGDKGDPGQNGTDGKDGSDGRGVEAVKVENGKLYIKYTDGEDYICLGDVKGDKGDSGADGKDGEDGKNLDINEVYAAAVKGGYTGSFLEFISAYLKVEVSSSSEQIVSKTFLSTVAIASKFAGDAVSSGSGVIYKGNKTTGEVYIVTNFHVIYSSSYTPAICNEVYVFFYGIPFVRLSKDNSNYTAEELEKYMLIEDYGVKAKYVAGSQSNDIAVLKIENCELYKNGPYRPAELIDDSDDLKEGETTYVVGNAEGNGISATSGILSLQSSELTLSPDSASGVKYTYRVLRTDAAVNHGNSGGGLYNKDGKLIGIVNSKTQSVTVDNMGYAIPLNVVLGTVHNLLERAGDNVFRGDEVYVNGYGYNKCLLGVTVREINAYADYDEESGLVTSKAEISVVEVSEGSAASGYLQSGDIILDMELNGIKRKMYRKYQIGDLLLYGKKGDVAILSVRRGGETITVNIPLTVTAYQY